MTIRFTLSAALAASTMALAAQPAAAQVQGIATADTSVAIAGSQARGTAYSQIGTQYQSFTQQITQKRTEINTMQQQLYKQFDANGDSKIDDAELAKLDASKSPVKTQIQQKTAEIQQLQAPIVKAQMFAIGEIAKKYGDAQQNVIKSKKITMMLSPESFLYAPDQVNVTRDVTSQLNTLVPSVGVTPPANWQPSRQLAALYQQVQQVLGLAARQAAAQQAQAAGQAPAAAAPAPATR